MQTEATWRDRAYRVADGRVEERADDGSWATYFDGAGGLYPHDADDGLAVGPDDALYLTWVARYNPACRGAVVLSGVSAAAGAYVPYAEEAPPEEEPATAETPPEPPPPVVA